METPTLDYSKETKEEEKKGLKKDTSIVLNTPFMRFVYNVVEPWSEIANGQLLTEEEYKKLKVEIEEYARMWIFYTLFPVVGTAFVSFLIYWHIFNYYYDTLFPKIINIDPLLVSLICTVICTALTSFFVFYLIESHVSKKRKKVRAYELTYIQNEAQEDPFKYAIKTSYTYLNRYYDQTQKQAKQGFGITVVIAGCGAALIFVGVITMYLGFVEPAYITCASGVITEFISSIFFAMYNKTVTSMNSYHDKLVLSQNIAFALRVADSLEKNKDAAKLEIIKELMKDVNAQMMKSDADDSEPSKKKPSPDAETPSGNE